ncbi:MAG TPA: hypothetical protein PKL31_18020 [Fulvivirga sp.]|nr:hypothetical protein [Fulvivirga sp.]
MEKRLRRIEIAILILLIISTVNFVIPFLTDENKSDIETPIDLPDLPEDLTRDLLNKTVYKIKIDFNHSDWTEFYNVFGDYAKAQLSTEEIEREFKKLKAATGNIGTYAYSHYVYEGNGSNAEWFEIHYKCRFERGKGTIKVSTRTVDGISEVIGVNINLDEL